ncbi:actinia tenebrosa protease inhibitors-like [Mytilus trossulus]|uniref:actinia tenebrosa protease inhibitors-like n=1 Tax=Mytilus trossulus TaxID=6551 RepID=UPI003004074D
MPPTGLSSHFMCIRLFKVVGVYSSENICDLPKVVGPCRGSFPRFHYDVKTGLCKKFVYGGCGGNENNFKTKKDCLTTCKKRVCTLPKISGTGPLSISRWFYNVESMKCEKFIYRGGKRNKNSFRNKKKCERLCKGIKKDPCGPIRDCARPLPVCSLPKLSGTGPLSIPRWFYNVEIMKCEKFIYRGGKRNKNSFRTTRECERLCQGIEKDSCGPPRDCARPPPGTCVESVFQIINGEKCYAGCKYPRCKKGSCPTSAPPSPCSNTCNEGHNGDDTSCPGDQLCCRGGCCRDPILEPKIGDCPKDPRPKTCLLKQSECQLDGQCNGKRKCCRFTCHKFCVDPDENK